MPNLIRQSVIVPRSLTLLADRYAIAKLDPDASVPLWVTGEFTSVTRTADELSIVCQDENIPVDVSAEREWRLLKVGGPLIFGEIGILSSLLGPLAEAGISVFTLSTYETDYLLLKNEKISLAIDTLTRAGHIVRDQSTEIPD